MATASSSRTRSATKKAAARPPVGRQLEGVEPVELSSSAPDREPDLVHIFSVDGTPYYLDRNQDATVALTYLRLVRSEGQNVALSYMFEEVMGTEAYEALMNCKGLTPAQLGQVMLVVQTVLLGSQDHLPKARSGRA